MKNFIAAVLVIVALSTGCASYSFKCVKTVGFALDLGSAQKSLTGLCDGKKTNVMSAPAYDNIKVLCNSEQMHWYSNQDNVTCIDDPCAVAGKKTIFNPNGSTVCGN